MRRLYLKTTRDELELPLAVADSPGELGRITGTKPNIICSSIAHGYKGWCRVEVEDETERDVYGQKACK